MADGEACESRLVGAGLEGEGGRNLLANSCACSLNVSEHGPAAAGLSLTSQCTMPLNNNYLTLFFYSLLTVVVVANVGVVVVVSVVGIICLKLVSNFLCFIVAGFTFLCNHCKWHLTICIPCTH